MRCECNTPSLYDAAVSCMMLVALVIRAVYCDIGLHRFYLQKHSQASDCNEVHSTRSLHATWKKCTDYHSIPAFLGSAAHCWRVAPPDIAALTRVLLVNYPLTDFLTVLEIIKIRTNTSYRLLVNDIYILTYWLCYMNILLAITKRHTTSTTVACSKFCLRLGLQAFWNSQSFN